MKNIKSINNISNKYLLENENLLNVIHLVQVNKFQKISVVYHLNKKNNIK